MIPRQLTAAQTFALRPRELEAALLAGSCDQLLDLIPRRRPQRTQPEPPLEETTAR